MAVSRFFVAPTLAVQTHPPSVATGLRKIRRPHRGQQAVRVPSAFPPLSPQLGIQVVLECPGGSPPPCNINWLLPESSEKSLKIKLLQNLARIAKIRSSDAKSQICHWFWKHFGHHVRSKILFFSKSARSSILLKKRWKINDFAPPKPPFSNQNSIKISSFFQHPFPDLIFPIFDALWCQNAWFWHPLGTGQCPKRRPKLPKCRQKWLPKTPGGIITCRPASTTRFGALLGTILVEF